MANVRCPQCNAELTDELLGEGWCRCGKRIPVGQGPARGKTRRWWNMPAPRPRLFGGYGALLLCIFGSVLIALGVQEWRVNTGTNTTASFVDLASLEAGEPLPQNHVRFGRHIRLHVATVYSTDLQERGKENPRVYYSFYPIVSATNPWVRRVADWQEAGDNEAPFPEPENLKVLVKSTAASNLRDLPTGVVTSESISGLIINEITSLNNRERELINQRYPHLDTATLLILEEGREPKSRWVCVALMALGGCLFVPAGIWLVRRLRQS